MAEKKVIVLQDGAHGPAEAGDTIPVSSLPLSAEQGNTLQAKGDGLFAAAEFSFTEAPQGPANTTSGDDVPTEFFGPGRDKLLAEPDKWLEVTIGGERGVMPWFKLS